MKKQKLFSLLSLTVLCAPYFSVPKALADTIEENTDSLELVAPDYVVEQPDATNAQDVVIEETLPSSENTPAENSSVEEIPESSQTSSTQTPEIETTTSDTQVPTEATEESQDETSSSTTETSNAETETENTSSSQLPEEPIADSSTSVEEETSNTTTQLPDEAETTAPSKNETVQPSKPAPSTEAKPPLGETSYTSITRPNDFNFNGFLGEFDASKFDFSKDVLKWQPLVEKEAEKVGLKDYTVLLLAIMQVESGGRGTKDIMQSSESAGLAPNSITNEASSIRQSLTYLGNVIDQAKSFEKNYETNLKLLAQAYNFGSGFIKFVDEHANGIYNVSVAEDYSLTYLAPTLGNKTGETYTYKNEFSTAFGKEYLYRNGGNFYYGNIVSAYLYQEFAPVLMAIEEFQGNDYVFGGKSPINGFDCSGLVSWGLNEVGVSLASYTVTQWENTEYVDPEDAKPGDLIFFRGTYGEDPNFISHIEFYINETTMFGSNSSGVGYHTFDSDYWQTHFAGIRRVKDLTTEKENAILAQN